jgi:HEAT repeat protein
MAESSDDNLRSEALQGLMLIGPEAKAAVPVLQKVVKKETNSSRFLAASEALGKADPAAAAQTLCEVLRDDNNYARRAWALTVLEKIAPQGEEAVPTLKTMVEDSQEDAGLRVSAINVLWRMQQPSEPLVAVLCGILSEHGKTVGMQAITVLEDMGPAARPALPALLKLLDDRQMPLDGKRWGRPYRAAVITALGRIGPPARAAVPAMIASLQSGNYTIRTEVALALARIGPAAREALAARDAAVGATITLLSTKCPAGLTAAPLVEEACKLWVPATAQTRGEIHDAIEQVDPGALAESTGMVRRRR